MSNCLKEKLVSVIIPVYNVAEYLDRCLKSVTEQSYYNLEIILIDDGSTDISGKLCDIWEKKDSRIKVIHKKNGGLSEARNYGLDKATGDYISFLDSDDWISSEMIDQLVTSLESNNSDIACCGMTSTDEKIYSNIPWFKSDQLLTRKEALDYLVENKLITSHVMPKIYKRELWSNQKFPVGKEFEDIYIMHKVFLECNTVYINHHHLYFYYDRPNSISKTPSLKMWMEWILALISRREDLIGLDKKYYCEITAQIAVVYSISMIQKRYSNDEYTEYKYILKTCNKELHNHETIKYVKQYCSKRNYHYCLLQKCLGKYGYYVYRLLTLFCKE